MGKRAQIAILDVKQLSSSDQNYASTERYQETQRADAYKRTSKAAEVSTVSGQQDAAGTSQTQAVDSNKRQECGHSTKSGGGEKIALKKSLGVSSACAMVLGTIIGSGIFVSPKGILREVRSIGLSLSVWLGVGILAMMGALTYTELGTMMPESGGAYVYIRRVFGGFAGFLYMWAMIVVVMPAHNAIIALTFSQYMTQPFFPGCEPPFSCTIMLAAIAIG